MARLDRVTAKVLEKAKANPSEVGAASVEYLQLMGYTIYAWLWARMAQVAQSKRGEDEAFYGAKLATADFYFARILPRSLALEACICSGSESLFGLSAEQF